MLRKNITAGLQSAEDVSLQDAAIATNEQNDAMDLSFKLPAAANTLVYKPNVYMPKIEQVKMKDHMRKMNRKGKKKYAVLMEVQRILVNSPDQATNEQLEKVEFGDSMKKLNSVKPKQRFKALLPEVLAFQDATQFRDRKQKEKPSMSLTKPQKNIKNLRERTDLSHRSILEQNAASPKHDFLKKKKQFSAINSPNFMPSGPSRLNINRVSPSKLNLNTNTSPVNFFKPKKAEKVQAMNPQQEALSRQEQILEQIKYKTQQNFMPLAQKKKKIDGTLYTFNDSSASKLEYPQRSTRNMFTASPHEADKEKSRTLNQEELDIAKAQSMLDGHGPTSQHKQDKAKRIFVSEESGCMNLTSQDLRSELSMTVHTAAERARPIVAGGGLVEKWKPKRGKDKEHAESSISPRSRQQLSTAGTLPKKYQKQQNETQHSQYLIELMRPFANRAGNQGIGAKQSFRAMPQSSQVPERPFNQSHGLSPLDRHSIERRKKKQLHEAKNRQALGYQSAQEDPQKSEMEMPDEYDQSSLGTKRSPFKQHSVAEESEETQVAVTKASISASQNQIEQKPPHVQQKQPLRTGTLVQLERNNRQVVHSLIHSQSRFSSSEMQVPTGGHGRIFMKNNKTPTALHSKGKFSHLDPEMSKQELNLLSQAHVLSQTLQSEANNQTNYNSSNLPYMTQSSCFWHEQRRSQPPKNINERVKLLPLKVKQELHATQASQLFDFYQAMLQPSIAPFVQMPHVTSFTPKIGSKVSMLANVRETLTKRYQLAKAVRIESHRRMNIIERLKMLRDFIKQNITFRPTGPDDIDVHEQLLDRIAFLEAKLIDSDIKDLLREVFETGIRAQHHTAALQIQTWIRMAICRRKYKHSIATIIKLQRKCRDNRIIRAYREFQRQKKLKAVKLLQRYLRGYLAYNEYYARLKCTMTKKNLDYIINRYADAKAFALECLQIKLAYLARKLIKRRRYEEEQRRLAKLAEKKRKEEEKKRRLAAEKHAKRKLRKKAVKAMLMEVVDICYKKEDERREEILAKEKKKLVQQPKANNKQTTKYDFPLEAVQFVYKETLFEKCYKKIKKRLAAKKKKPSKPGDTKASAALSTMLKDSQSNLGKNSATRNMNEPSKSSTPAESRIYQASVPQVNVADPHHFSFVLDNRKIRIAKFEKHPDPKKRRKESVTFECSLECLEREQQKVTQNMFRGSDFDLSISRDKSRLKQTKDAFPEQVNISICAAMGNIDAEATDLTFCAGVEGDNRQAPLTQGGRRTVNLNLAQSIQNECGGMDDVRTHNDEMSDFDMNDDASNSSEALTFNSESADFLEVYLPMIRPAEPSSESDIDPTPKTGKKPMEQKSNSKLALRKTSTKVSKKSSGKQVQQELNQDLNPNPNNNNQVALTGFLGMPVMHESVEEQLEDLADQETNLAPQPQIHETGEFQNLALQPQIDETEELPSMASQPQIDATGEFPNLTPSPQIDETEELPNLAPQPQIDETEELPNLTPQPLNDESEELPNFTSQPQVDETEEEMNLAPQPQIHQIEEVTDDGHTVNSPVRIRQALSSSSKTELIGQQPGPFKEQQSLISEYTGIGMIDQSKASRANIIAKNPTSLAVTKSGMLLIDANQVSRPNIVAKNPTSLAVTKSGMLLIDANKVSRPMIADKNPTSLAVNKSGMLFEKPTMVLSGLNSSSQQLLDTKSQQQITTLQGQSEDQSQIVFHQPLLVQEEQSLNQYSESMTVNQVVRSKLQNQANNSNIINGSEVTVTSTKSDPKQEGQIVEETKGEVNKMSSTTTLLTQMGAYYKQESITIFQSNAVPIKVPLDPSNKSSNDQASNDQAYSSVRSVNSGVKSPSANLSHLSRKSQFFQEKTEKMMPFSQSIKSDTPAKDRQNQAKHEEEDGVVAKVKSSDYEDEFHESGLPEDDHFNQVNNQKDVTAKLKSSSYEDDFQKSVTSDEDHLNQVKNEKDVAAEYQQSAHEDDSQKSGPLDKEDHFKQANYEKLIRDAANKLLEDAEARLAEAKLAEDDEANLQQSAYEDDFQKSGASEEDYSNYSDQYNEQLKKQQHEDM